MTGGLMDAIVIMAKAANEASAKEVESQKVELAKREAILQTLPESERLKQQTAWDLIDAIKYSSRSTYIYNYGRY